MTPEQQAAADERIRLETEQTQRRSRALAIDQLAGRLGKRYAPSRASFDRYQIYHDNQKPVVARLKALLPTLREFIANGRGILLCGTVGTGKDHLLASMLYAALEVGVSCDWLCGLDLFARFRDAIGSDRRESEVIATFAKSDVLAISDPTPPMSLKDEAWRIEQLYRVIDARNRALKSTWATINVNSPAEAEARLSSQVFDRLRDGAELMGCFWPSFREGKQ